MKLKRTHTDIIAKAMDMLARDVESRDGVANAAIGEAAQRLRELQSRVNKWEAELGAVMPADLKDWHQNDPLERPAVGRWVIENLRNQVAELYDTNVGLCEKLADMEKQRDQYRGALEAKHGGEPIALLAELDAAREEIERWRTATAKLRDASEEAGRVANEQLARADAELAALRRDKERMDWLECEPTGRLAEARRIVWQQRDTSTAVRAAIDATMKEVTVGTQRSTGGNIRVATAMVADGLVNIGYKEHEEGAQ